MVFGRRHEIAVIEEHAGGLGRDAILPVVEHDHQRVHRGTGCALVPASVCRPDPIELSHIGFDRHVGSGSKQHLVRDPVDPQAVSLQINTVFRAPIILTARVPICAG